MKEPQSIEVVAAAIIRNNSVFVAQRNAHQSHPLCWEFPGGKVEATETHAEALARELHEEFGIVAHVAHYITQYRDQSEEKIIHLHLYRCFIEVDEISPLEHACVQWVSPEQLQGLTLTPADRAMLPELLSVMAHNPSVWSALPQELDCLPTKAGGQHLFSALQRPWHYTHAKPKLGAKAYNLLNSAYNTDTLHIQKRLQSDDGTTRIIFATKDGAIFESIHMPRELRSARVTLCLSSQSGCAMGCAFCATAKLGLKRNLSAGEILCQVLQNITLLGPNNAHSINIVFMGMGEPLMNTAEVMRAIQVLCNVHGLNIPDKRITLSTCGVLSELPKLLSYPHRPNIAISLNAVTDQKRSMLMPINRRFPLEEIRKTLLDWPYRSHEKILLEYVLLGGINDSAEDAKLLAEFAQGFAHNINIIPYNESLGCTFHAPNTEKVLDFLKILQEAGCFATIRVARGVEVGGACGQLSGQ